MNIDQFPNRKSMGFLYVFYPRVPSKLTWIDIQNSHTCSRKSCRNPGISKAFLYVHLPAAKYKKTLGNKHKKHSLGIQPLKIPSNNFHQMGRKGHGFHVPAVAVH